MNGIQIIHFFSCFCTQYILNDKFNDLRSKFLFKKLSCDTKFFKFKNKNINAERKVFKIQELKLSLLLHHSILLKKFLKIKDNSEQDREQYEK